jgi:hypothetical protein
VDGDFEGLGGFRHIARHLDIGAAGNGIDTHLS